MASRYEISPHERTGYIYGLHSGDGVIRYVGQTCRLKARMTEHVIHARRADTHSHNQELAQWVNSIGVLHVQLLEINVPESLLDGLERKWIVALDMRSLFNKSAGGSDAPKGERNYWYGRKHTDETKAKMGLKGEAHPAFGKRSPKAIFSVEQEVAIHERVARGETRRSIALELGVHPTTIERIAKGVLR